MRNPLTASFQKRMLPLALLSGLLVGGGLPAVYSHGLRTELAREAKVIAEGVTSRLMHRVHLRPRLWAYDVEGLDTLIQPLKNAYPGISVVIQTADESRAYVLDEGVGTKGVSGAATLQLGSKNIARVMVHLDVKRFCLS